MPAGPCGSIECWPYTSEKSKLRSNGAGKSACDVGQDRAREKRRRLRRPAFHASGGPSDPTPTPLPVAVFRLSQAVEPVTVGGIAGYRAIIAVEDHTQHLRRIDHVKGLFDHSSAGPVGGDHHEKSVDPF